MTSRFFTVCRLRSLPFVFSLLSVLSGLAELSAAGAAERQTLLLLGQGPDGHKAGTHEYMSGVRLLSKWLAEQPNLDVEVVQADGDWKGGPELIRQADAVVLFVSEGAKWIQTDPRRFSALTELAERGGGFTGIHWGIGTRPAEYIDGCLRLIGGCHGGPDRKYTVVESAVQIASPRHPVTAGLSEFSIREEFYYRVKFHQPAEQITPLLRVKIDGRDETVAWAWQRKDKGRSVGFTGGHFHENWSRQEYRRLLTQAVLWTLNRAP